ncbi:hypothetical protein E4T52_00015 [Aureobasidium sp. EXF-3400]|nr:hypothetical protein E4T52_00015 [Aureobasidium sp. EXF-3400]
MAQDMVGSSFAPGDYKDLFQKEKDIQPVSITTPIMSSNQQANNTSKTIFGLPTAPATPQPEDTEKSSHPLQVFSFDKKPEKETCASKSFFGLPSGPKTHITSAPSSVFQATSATKTSTGSLFDFTPKMGDKVANEKPISWFSSLRAPTQDTNAANTTSPLDLSPKKATATGFTFSKIPESDSTASQTAQHATTNSQGTQGKLQKDVSDTQPLHVTRKTVSPIKSSDPYITSIFNNANLKMGNELSTDKPSPQPSLPDQGSTPGSQSPFKSFSDMTASLPQAEGSADNKTAAVKNTSREEAKLSSVFSQSVQSIQTKGKPSQNSNLFGHLGSDPVSNLGKTSTTAPKPTPALFKFQTNLSTMSISGEHQKYMQLHHTKDNKTSGADEQLRTTPLISLKVKEATEARYNKTSMFPQYAFLGCRIPEPCSSEEFTPPPTPIETQSIFGPPAAVQKEPEPVLLNTNTPWSAFICGSQGSAIIENCLYPSPSIGKLPRPLAGVVFHNSTISMHNICEAAHLVSLGVKVDVLVSRSNFHALSAIYKSAVGAKHEKSLNIQPLVLQSHHLTAERMHRLMAFQEGETTIPLYMEVIMRILREMAITGAPFSYSTFKANLDNEGLQPGQKVMMDMRLNLLESFLDPSCVKPTNRASSRKADLFTTSPGTLTIVDLSDPFLDSSTTCTLFSILLDVFLASRPTFGLLVCLDEAHKFMKNTPAAETFTGNLLTVIREQRHNACRIVIATQEPTISPKLLDLCSMTFVHRFTSPDWLSTLRGHLAGASDLVIKSQGEGESKKLGAASLFEKIIELDVGESLLFAPSAVLEEKEGKVKKLGVQCVKFKTRKRLGVDGGQSVLAVRE